MAIPTKKSAQMEAFVNRHIADHNKSGLTRVEAITQDKCAWCGLSSSPDSFDDESSQREYAISGLCQACQDDIFG